MTQPGWCTKCDAGIMRLATNTSACRIAVVASTSTMIAFFDVDHVVR